MDDKKIKSLSEIEKIGNTQLQMEELTKYVNSLPKNITNTILAMVVEAVDYNAAGVEENEQAISSLQDE